VTERERSENHTNDNAYIVDMQLLCTYFSL